MTSSGPAWAYIGSANCSESAWGKLISARGSKEPKLNCRNWECGVILPVEESGPPRPIASTSSERNLDVFKGTIPVPMQYPGTELTHQSPWFYAEQ